MQFYKEKLLSPGQLKRLSEHKYSCTTNSLLDGFLQPWWDWLVSKVPLWLAPNLITIVGLIVNIATTLILVYYSPDAKTEAPRWACFLCALGLFIYQSLDAIDGKQARRTGTSTPLGELFDHGCDSISTVFIALSACIAVQLGYYPTWMFFQCFCAMTLFYCAHWQTYVSGSLRFGKVDVTEAQFTIIMIHLISAIFGPQVWMIEIPYIDGFMFKYLIGVMTVICAMANLYFIFSVIFTGGVGKNGSTVALPYTGTEVKVFPLWAAVGIAILLAQSSISVILAGGVGKNGSTVAGTSVLSPIIPFSFVVVPAFIIYRKSAEHVYENHPALYILAFGMVAAKVTNRLVVAHMTKNEMEYLDTSLIGPAMLFLNQYFNFFIKEYYVLWLCFIWVTLDLLRYNTQICLEICDYMKIKLFRIPLGDHRTSLVSNTAEKNVRAMVEQEPLLDEDYHHGSDTTLDL
ncbi:choline/ethanolaminephosphotransferase 1 bbc isoform X4 [Bombus vancouverensis nearcticus]|uniref:diacylglycerol cholinephosphotransferase n=2 Tax=Pyrobombus TaxID=144703 RepID=A0A6P8LX45_9HYME|nr:cholinephosphotransferase 1 isoform X2 [Bombus impatiens]XP_033190927.1 cholinephosphotransferase 1 isoform X2 [Bombus vancouverensis nearcticus]XP_033300023.1 cholinephosphotransferase 1 isoform X2 [Bombus bifarius]XP_050483463.1 cholinephosphotransferase 1 isoform X2 [Bombus huntii]